MPVVGVFGYIGDVIFGSDVIMKIGRVCWQSMGDQSLG